MEGRRFKPENDSDAESGRSAELIQNGRPKAGAIPPDALYTAPKQSDATNSAERPLYENVKPDQNDNQNPGSLVYASLDLPSSGQSRNGQARSRNTPRHDRTEYAEIQFQPKATEQADI